MIEVTVVVLLLCWWFLWCCWWQCRGGDAVAMLWCWLGVVLDDV